MGGLGGCHGHAGYTSGSSSKMTSAQVKQIQAAALKTAVHGTFSVGLVLAHDVGTDPAPFRHFQTRLAGPCGSR